MPLTQFNSATSLIGKPDSILQACFWQLHQHLPKIYELPLTDGLRWAQGGCWQISWDGSYSIDISEECPLGNVFTGLEADRTRRKPFKRIANKETENGHYLPEVIWQYVLPKHSYPLGFPGGAVVGGPPANVGDTGSCPGPGGSHMLRSD